MAVKTWLAERAWVNGSVERNVLIETTDGVVTRVEPTASPGDAVNLRGLIIPGFVNTHSHAFHRALRGRTHGDTAGDFWGWRDLMYSVAERLDPERYHALACTCFAEMALAGITHVFEFHYLHDDGMAEAVVAAAAEVGIRITLLDTLYLRAGFGDEELHPVQRRFVDKDVDAWAARVAASKPGGVAIHSVRAVDPESMAKAASFAAERELPLHVHVSEQPAENQACLAATGRTPVQLLADTGVLGPRTTAVHAVHTTDADIRLVAESGSSVCVCPTTERDLADGVAPVRRFAAAGIPLTLGTDSHALIDMFEEARAAELDERLVSGRRDGLSGTALLHAATGGGVLAVGQPADFVAVSLSSVRTAGADDENVIDTIVFAATAADVTDVVVGGRRL